jgi:hypothetical protein
MKKLVVLSATVAALTAGFAAPASADTVSLPYGGTATLTIPDVTLTPGGNCVSHLGTFSISHVDYWNVDITANGPTTWPATEYLYGTGPQSRIVELQLCPSFDGPGLYTASGLVTVEDPYSYNQQEVLISDQFVISHPAPPPPPPPPPAPVYTDVSGTVASKKISKGVKLTFRSAATPAGTLTGKPLRWMVKYDGRTKRITQSASETDTLKLRFSGGRHIVKIFRNGSKIKTLTVRG